MSQRVHIIGSGPRTGTTLLHEVMKTCYFFSNVCDHEASICVSNSALGGGETILTKYPVEIDIVGWALALDPRLSVICIVRDPRDMVVSFHGADPDVFWASLKFWSFFLSHFDSVADRSRFVVLRYEDFVREPDLAQKKIEDRIPGLSARCPFSEYHKHSSPGHKSALAMKKVRPIEPKGIGSWKTHLQRVKQQLRVHGGISESLVRFGYEESSSWEKLLKDVEIADFATRTGEHFSDEELGRRLPRKLITATNIIMERIGLNPERTLSPFKKLYRWAKR